METSVVVRMEAPVILRLGGASVPPGCTGKPMNTVGTSGAGGMRQLVKVLRFLMCNQLSNICVCIFKGSLFLKL